ncbi:probable nuclear pore complex protein Nup160 at C-terminar half [Coccomyxa sp. Obi]|nr:probable nuclear pore complex protein Nup160 at C-terminar half [Coccomyxa sp. Obi]
MASQRVAELFVESLLIQQPLTSNRLDVSGQGEPGASVAKVDGNSAGGGIQHGSQGRSGLLWSIDAEEPSVLNLLGFSSDEPVRESALRLAFSSALSPHVAMDVSGPDSSVYAVSASGHVHTIALPGPQDQGDADFVSMLASMPSDGSAISSADLSSELPRLGAPTALAAVDGVLCMGCENGSVLCIPQASLRAGTPEGAYELKDAGGVGRLLSSFFGRQATPAVKGLAPVRLGSRQLLAAAYADGSLRLWDLRRQACVLHELLKPDSTTVDAMAPTRLRFAPAPTGEARRPGKLVVQFDRPEPASAGEDSHFAVFELNGDVSPDGSSISALSLQQVAILERSGATSASGPAADLAAHQRPGGRVRAWALGRDGCAFAMDEAAVARGVRGGEARLLGDDVSGLTSASEAQLQLQEDLWHSITREIERLTGQALPLDVPARHFVGSLLAPGRFSHTALKAALAVLGRDIASADLTRQPVSDLQQLTLQAVRERAADVGQFAAVHALLRAYWGALLAAQRPLGLLQGGPGAPSIVRAGPSLGLLRPAGAAAAQALGLAVPGHPAPSQALQRLAVASGKLRDLLGPYVHSLVSQLLAEGMHLGQAIMPALVHAIAIGPSSSVASGAKAGAQGHVREVQSQWRRQRSRLALEVRALLDPIRNPEEAFSSFVVLLRPAAPLQQQSSAPAASQQALPASSFLAAVARDEADALADGAQDILLLLAYLGTVHTQSSLSSQNSSVWQTRLAAEAEAALRRAEIVRWLCTAPGAPTRSASGDPAALLHQLRLGRDPTDAAFPPRPAPAQVHVKTLAEALLPHFAPSLAASAESATGMAALGVEFASALLHGVDHGSSEGGLSEQVMSIGRVLFTEKQLPPLLPLLRLAGPVSNDPGLQFLQGYALLDKLRSTADPAQRQRCLDDAAGPLFRAAADLAAPGTADGRESYVRGLLGVLAADMMGLYQPEGPEAERLQYYETLMLACERLGCPEGAARFAQAAVRQVDVAFPADGRMAGAPDGAARATREGRLWSNLFVYSLDVGQYEAAYAAMQANPVPERQLDCLQRLLGELCSRGEIATLVSLPFAGTLDVARHGSGPAMLSLGDEALKFLRRRADNAELGSRPQPYQVLYDFCVSRGEFREAAAAQLALARRLRDEDPKAVHAVHAALSAALGALSLVDSAHAWLEDAAGADLALTQQAFHTSPLPNRFLPSTAWPRSPLPGRYNEDPLSAAAAGPALVTPESLRKELALARAISLAAKSGSESAGAADRPADVLQLLLAKMQFEAAVRLAEALYSGAELAKWLEKIVTSLAAACVRLQLQENQAIPGGSHTDAAGLPSHFSTSTGDGGADGEAQASAASAWGVLRRFLEGGPGGGPSAARLRAAAADAILAAQPRFCLPAWLLHLFQEGDPSKGMAGSAADPAALLRIYIKRGRLEDAASLALTHLHAWQTQVVDVERQRHGGVWFPHDLLGDLLARLGSPGAPPGAARLRLQLQEALHAHYSSALQQSDILEQRSMAVG